MSFYDTYASNVARISQGAADARAQAELQRGNIWANAFGQLGQLAAAIPGQLEAQKDREAERERQSILTETARLNLQQARRQEADRNVLSNVLEQSIVDGRLDPQRVMELSAQSGLGPLGMELATSVAQFNTSVMTYQQAVESGDQAKIDRAAQNVAMHLVEPIVQSDFDPRVIEGSFTAADTLGVDTGAWRTLWMQQPEQFAQKLLQMSKKPQNLMKLGPDETLVDVSNLGPDGKPRVVVQGTPEERVLTLDQQLGQAQQRMAAATTPAERDAARNEINNIIRTMGQAASSTRAPERVDVETPPPDVLAADSDSQDIMGHTGLGYNAFMAATGRLSSLPRGETRNRATSELQQWAAKKGVDVATLQSQFNAYNQTLKDNIERANSVYLISGEIEAGINNLKQAAVDLGFTDARALNAVKAYIGGEFNNPDVAAYGVLLEGLVNDILRFNTTGRKGASYEEDLRSARNVLRSGISSGTLDGLQKALRDNMQRVLDVQESAVDLSRKKIWELFGVGDRYRPSRASGGGNQAGQADLIFDAATGTFKRAGGR